MPISLLGLLEPALDRTRRILFQPFDLRKWLVIGFGCWLAQLAHGGHGGPRWSFGLPANGASLGQPGSFPAGFALGLLALLALVGLALMVAVLWVSSRGALVFLDNVSFNRAAIAAPWKRYAVLGDSLFRWRLAFVAVVLLTVLASVGAFLLAGGSWWLGEQSGLPLAASLVGGSLLALCLLTALFVGLLLNSFVVPVMAAEGLGCRAAWTRFLTVFRPHLGTLLLYGLMVLAFGLALAAATVALGFSTCCLGFLLLAIPYLGTVVLLPAFVFLRCFSLELLAAVEPSWNLFESRNWSTERSAPPAPADSERFSV